MINILCPPKMIKLGRQGENEFQTIKFDVAPWLADYPDGTISILYMRPDGVAYPPDVSTVNGVTSWEISEVDTAVPGQGVMVVRLIDGDIIGKSANIPTMVSMSINGSEIIPPPPDWTIMAARLLAMIGDLANLNTEAKNNLVAAINEVIKIAENPHPYTSLARKGSYLYEVTFADVPDFDGGDGAVLAGCSSYVADGKLYRNLDWDYSELASFRIIAPSFEGMAFTPGLTDTELDDDLIGQLPYRIVDGCNNYGIRVATHVVFNDWEWQGNGNTPLYKLPYIILSTVKSLDNLGTQLADVLSDLYATPTLTAADYLLQFVVTDGVTTYAILPPESNDGSYIVVDITENPKLTNFRWVADASVDRAELQQRPTGVERWNMMPCELSDLRFTEAYEAPDRLSEFIGIDGTDKDSTDEELTAIYDRAHAAYMIRTRDGQTWQTMHSVVYGADGIEHLWVQENWERDYAAAGGGGDGTSDHRDLSNRSADNQHPMSAITGLVAALAAKGTYSKPPNGIPYADLAEAVKQSLGRADSALQIAPVASVNGKTGAVNLVPSDLGIGSVFALKGSKPTYADLPATGNTIGDVWYVVADSVGYIWLNDGTVDRWEPLGMEIDLSAYYTKTESEAKFAEKDDFVDEEQIVIPAYTNLVDMAGYADGKLLNSNGAEADSASQFVTGFIPVTKGDVIRFKPHDNIYADSCVVAFYDAQKTITSGIGKTFSAIVGQATYGSPTIADNTFTIDTANIGYYFWSNIAYVRFCGNGGGADAIITIDEEISGTVTEIKYTLKEEIKVKEASLDFPIADALKGRNIVCFGDSILALIRNETGVLAQASKMTGGNFINCAFGGCRMSAHPESKYDAFSFYQLANAVASNDFSDQDTAAVATGVPDYYPEQLARLKAVDWDEVDEIIVAYGTNDYDANVVIDGSTNSTIIGALKNGLSAILTAYPHIKVNIAGTIFRMWSNVGSDVHTNTNGDKLPDVNNALREVAAERKANYIDLYNTCGITAANASTMLSDGTHPSAVGCKIIGRVYGGSIVKPTSANTALKDDLDDYQTKTITDTAGYFTTDTVEGALAEIGAELAGINTLIGSGVIT